MSQSTIAIIVMVVALILYAIPRIPLSVTTIFAMLAMPFFGIIDYGKAFSGFANTSTLLIAGMMVIGQACFTSGLAEKMSNVLYRFSSAGEKTFMAVLIVVVGGLSMFLNGAMVVAVFMPIIDAIAVKSNGRITRKHTYFPLGLASTMGNNITVISASSTITAAGLMSAAGHGEMDVFAPTLVNLPIFIIIIVLYILFGYKLQQRWFDFPETSPDIDVQAAGKGEKVYVKWKMVLTAATLIVVIIAMLAGMNYGACALLGSAILILTGCIDEKVAFRSINWSVVIIIAGAIGFSAGLSASGAGTVIADAILSLAGPLGKTPVGICCILFLISSILSNLMSDNATIAIIVPIGMAMAVSMGSPVLPFVLAVASGTKVALATPISVATMTMVQAAGYRFKDYLRVGGLCNLIAMIGTIISIKLVFFM